MVLGNCADTMGTGGTLLGARNRVVALHRNLVVRGPLSPGGPALLGVGSLHKAPPHQYLRP